MINVASKVGPHHGSTWQGSKWLPTATTGQLHAAAVPSVAAAAAAQRRYPSPGRPSHWQAAVGPWSPGRVTTRFKISLAAAGSPSELPPPLGTCLKGRGIDRVRIVELVGIILGPWHGRRPGAGPGPGQLATGRGTLWQFAASHHCRPEWPGSRSESVSRVGHWHLASLA